MSLKIVAVKLLLERVRRTKEMADYLGICERNLGRLKRDYKKNSENGFPRMGK